MDGDGGDEAFTSLSNSESINSEDFDLFEGRTSKFSTLSDFEHIVDIPDPSQFQSVFNSIFLTNTEQQNPGVTPQRVGRPEWTGLPRVRPGGLR